LGEEKRFYTVWVDVVCEPHLDLPALMPRRLKASGAGV
jgi:hypothetical protein